MEYFWRVAKISYIFGGMPGIPVFFFFFFFFFFGGGGGGVGGRVNSRCWIQEYEARRNESPPPPPRIFFVSLLEDIVYF